MADGQYYRDEEIIPVTEIIDPDEDVSFVNSVVKVGAKWCPACKDAGKWMKKNYGNFPHVRFYNLDINTFKPDDFPQDKMLSARVKRVQRLPTFLIYHNNHLVARIEGWDEKELLEKIKKHLIPIKEKYVDHRYVNDLVKRKIERRTREERAKDPIGSEPPLPGANHDNPIDISSKLDQYAKRY